MWLRCWLGQLHWPAWGLQWALAGRASRPSPGTVPALHRRGLRQRPLHDSSQRVPPPEPSAGLWRRTRGGGGPNPKPRVHHREQLPSVLKRSCPSRGAHGPRGLIEGRRHLHDEGPGTCGHTVAVCLVVESAPTCSKCSGPRTCRGEGGASDTQSHSFCPHDPQGRDLTGSERGTPEPD